jgi:hypothetical protein
MTYILQQLMLVDSLFSVVNECYGAELHVENQVVYRQNCAAKECLYVENYITDFL